MKQKTRAACLLLRYGAQARSRFVLDVPSDHLKPGNQGISNLHSSDAGEYDW